MIDGPGPGPDPHLGEPPDRSSSATTPARQGGERTTDARLARLHLRGGLLALARAELEQMAGAGTLDQEALVDLAEARWRSGDLEGAAEAAEAHLATGGTEPIARLILAEEADRQGRLVDARHHVDAVVHQVGPGVDRLFAGEPHGAIWPPAPPQVDAHATRPGRWGLLVGGREVANPDISTWAPESERQPAPSPPVHGGEAAPAENTQATPDAHRQWWDAGASRAAGGEAAPAEIQGSVAMSATPEQLSWSPGQEPPGGPYRPVSTDQAPVPDWPAADWPAADRPALQDDRQPPASAGPAEPREITQPLPQAGAGSMDALMDAGRAAGRELDAIEKDLRAGALGSVASRLALLLRLDPALAPVIISTADRALASPSLDASGHAALNLVKGDAYRGLGRDLEATAAYQEAQRALPAHRSTLEES
jgi:hypothetical protein